MSMRRGFLLLCLVLISACTSDSDHADQPRAGLIADPQALVGDWSVVADGAPAETVLILRVRPAVTDLTIRMACGQVGGAWAAEARQDLFVGAVNAGSSACFGKRGVIGVGWLSKVTGFQTDGVRPLLVDAHGATVATLSPAASTPKPQLTTPPSLMSRHFGEPAPLPRTASAVTAKQVVGRWVPTGAHVPPKAFVAFSADGSWSASDGCNGMGGRYVVGSGGRLVVAADGISTLVYCDGSALPRWVVMARRVGLVGDALVFYDRTGKELGRAIAG